MMDEIIREEQSSNMEGLAVLDFEIEELEVRLGLADDPGCGGGCGCGSCCCTPTWNT